MVSTEPPPCRPEMPTAAQLLKDPAFATLEYRNRVNYEATRGAGYDLWGDSKFDYKAGLQFSLVPNKEARAGAQFCAQDVALRLAMPMDDRRREMLRAFVRAAAARTALKGDELLARLDELAARREKYRPIAKDPIVTVESGLVSSAVRGDFFVVAFIWPPQ
jgi:hypothetical protein